MVRVKLLTASFGDSCSGFCTQSPACVGLQNQVFLGAEAGKNEYWLVVWTPLKNISQLGWLFPIYGKIKNVPNHQPEYSATLTEGSLGADWADTVSTRRRIPPDPPVRRVLMELLWQARPSYGSRSWISPIVMANNGKRDLQNSCSRHLASGNT